MKTEETDIVVYRQTDSIECPECLKVLLFGDLVQKEGHKYPNNTSKPWQSMYYHCPCNLEKALVYDPGDSTPKRLVRGKYINQVVQITAREAVMSEEEVLEKANEI